MRLTEFHPVEPGTGYEDLRPLLEMVGDARVVGLGACAHGSREMQRTKHRIVTLLAEELSFSSVVLGANLAEVIRVNEFVLEGRGDPADLLPRHLFWAVSTEEMAALLRWMWEFNTSGHDRGIRLAGSDMQRIDTAVEIVTEHLRRVDSELAASVEERYERVLMADRARWLSGMGIQAWFPVEEARGKRIRFSGFIRTEGVTGRACIWGWAGGVGGTLAHDAMERRSPRGTTRWREYAIELDVPDRAAHVSLGCSLAGNGRAWFDGLAIEIDGSPWRDPERIDLDISSEEPRGFWVDPRNRAIPDAEVTRTGSPSLRIEPAEPVSAFEMSDMAALALAKEVHRELQAGLPGEGSGRALRCARAIVQSLELRMGGGDAARARSMAQNIQWLLERGGPDSRVVFWADNARVARGRGDTGSFLAEALGDQYLPVGFATGGGTCLAPARRIHEGLRTHNLEPAPAGSVERLLLGMAPPRAILDLRAVEEGDPEWGWLRERRLFRSGSGSAPPYEFLERQITRDFDLLFWIARTTAARPLPRKA